MGMEAVVFYWFLVFYGPREVSLYGDFASRQQCEMNRQFQTGQPAGSIRVSGCFAADQKALWWPIVDQSKSKGKQGTS